MEEKGISGESCESGEGGFVLGVFEASVWLNLMLIISKIEREIFLFHSW